MNEDGTYSGEESAEDSETAEEESATQSAMLSRNKMIVGLTTIIFAVQLILYYAVYYVQSLTKKSAGLNHHLRFRKTQLMNDYFPDYILFILSVVIVLAAIAFLIGYFKSQKNTWLRLSLGWLIVCSILSILFIYLPYFTDSLAYPYWIIIGLVNAVYSWLIFLLFNK